MNSSSSNKRFKQMNQQSITQSSVKYNLMAREKDSSKPPKPFGYFTNTLKTSSDKSTQTLSLEECFSQLHISDTQFRSPNPEYSHSAISRIYSRQNCTLQELISPSQFSSLERRHETFLMRTGRKPQRSFSFYLNEFKNMDPQIATGILYKQIHSVHKPALTAAIWMEESFFNWKAFYISSDDLETFDKFSERITKMVCAPSSIFRVFVYNYSLPFYDVISVD